MIQFGELEALVGSAAAQRWHNWVVTAMRVHGIPWGTQGRMWLAQVLHESGGLRHTLELASGEAYEGRADLGNTQPGDGPRFKGRGLIQLTGRNNYTRYATAAGHPVVDAPQLVELPRLAADSAAWYWASRGIGALFSDLSGEELLKAVTRRINGGLNGLDDRRRWLARVNDATTVSPAPPAPDDPTPEPFTLATQADLLVMNPPHSLDVAERMARGSVTGEPVIVQGPVFYRSRPAADGGTKLDVRVGESVQSSIPKVDGKAAIQSSGMIGSILSTGGAFALALFPAFGVDVTPELEQAAMQFIAAFGLLAINGRAKATKPITGFWKGN
jgi:predicted chitinase